MAVRIHPAAIDQICRFFNTHKKGLPEWMKNARDAYLRKDVSYKDRFVVIHYRSARGGRPPMLECIDFAGISGDDIHAQYMEWANPDAAPGPKKISGVEGEQGSGGKAYLRQLFERGYFASIEDGKLSVVSFIDEKKYELAFVPDIAKGKDNPGENPLLPDFRKYAQAWLKVFGFPDDHGITVVQGIAPVRPIDIDSLIEEIQQFPQARQTIKTCKVSLYVDSEFKRDLSVREPERDPGFSTPLEIPVPPVLDLYGAKIETCLLPAFPQGALKLKVSKTPLRGQALRTWNRIDFYGQGAKVIGYKDVPELELQHPEYANYIFGECTVPLLVNPKENYVATGRGSLVDGPLSQALYKFIASEVDKILAQLAKRHAGVAATKKRKNLEKLNQKLAQWIEGKLSSLKGLEQSGNGAGPGKKGRKGAAQKTHNPPLSLHIHRDELKICAGVQYDLRAYGKDASGKPVPPGKLTWKSKDPSIAEINPDNGKLTSRRLGLTYVTVTSDTGLSSDPLIVNVIEATKIEIKSSSPAKLGSNRRLPLLVYVTTKVGKVEKDSMVAWRTNDASVVSVGQDGVLVGGEIGEAEIVAYANGIQSDPLEVVVDAGSGGKPRGGGHGRPSFLLSGQDEDPFDNSSLVVLQSSDPMIYQRPYKPDYENNVVWINLQHPLAESLLAQGENSIPWRSYHFQRIVDAYTMIELRNRFEDSETLDVDKVLTEVHEIMASLYRDAKDELYDILYDESFDLSTL